MKTEIIKDNIQTAADILLADGLVAVPTETVYGLAGNGLSEEAVKKIYEVKGRPEVKAIALMVHDESAIDLYCKDAPMAAYELAGKYWPGPLTIILRSKDIVPDIVRAGGNTVGLRCPDHPLTLELLEKSGIPLAAPSANPSGAESPKDAETVLKYFDGSIDAVIDGGRCGIGTESTIIDMSKTPFSILRHGALPEAEIYSAIKSGVNIVGITGGTGCGKTTALNVLRDMGALIIDCDEVYHYLTVNSPEMRAELIERFGDVYDGNVLARKRLGAIVFSNPDALLQLNAITHKYVDMEVDKRILEHALNGGRLAAVDAIALLENKFAKLSLFNLGITAPTEERVKRLMLREGISEEYARMRIAAQKSNEYFEENCDYTLCNDGDIESFRNKCEKFFMEALKDVR